MHPEEFPVRACTISGDEDYFQTTTLQLANTFPYDWEELVCCYTYSSKMGVGKVQQKIPLTIKTREDVWLQEHAVGPLYTLAQEHIGRLFLQGL